MSIARDPEHSDGAPTIEGTGIRVKDVAVAYDNIEDFLSLVEESGFDHAGISYVQQGGRDIGDDLKTVDAHLESRSEDAAAFATADIRRCDRPRVLDSVAAAKHRIAGRAGPIESLNTFTMIDCEP